MLYKAVRFLFKNYIRLYFGKIQVFGMENIPKNSGVLLSPNHQNALLDPLIVAVFLKHPIYFFTRADVFIPALRRVFNSLHMLPIYRIRNGFSSLRKNKQTFEKGAQILAQGKHLVMFSEGLHHLGHYLYPISKGSSRFVLEAQQASKKQLYLVPVGINYSLPYQSGSDIHLVFGTPIAVPRLSKNSSVPFEINSLKERLEKEMQATLWIPEKTEHYEVQQAHLKTISKHQSFSEVRLFLSQTKQVPTSRKLINRTLKILLGIPNLLPILLMNFMSKGLKDPVFEGTVRFFGSLLVYPLWWFSVAHIASIYLDGRAAIAVTGVLISFKIIQNKINIIKTHI